MLYFAYHTQWGLQKENDVLKSNIYGSYPPPPLPAMYKNQDSEDYTFHPK